MSVAKLTHLHFWSSLEVVYVIFPQHLCSIGPSNAFCQKCLTTCRFLIHDKLTLLYSLVFPSLHVYLFIFNLSHQILVDKLDTLGSIGLPKLLVKRI